MDDESNKSTDVKEGLSFGVVGPFLGGGLLLFVLLIYFLFPWSSITAPSVKSAQVSEVSETKNSQPPAVKQPPAPPVEPTTVQNRNTGVKAVASTARGFLVLKGKIVSLDRVEGRISSDAKKIVLGIGPSGASEPAISVVFAFKNQNHDCAPEDLDKFQLRIDMTPFPVRGDKMLVVDRNPASDYLYQVPELTCERRPGGKIAINMVGDTPASGTDLITWSFKVETGLQ